MMFSTDTVQETRWYRITWNRVSDGTTATVERPDKQAMAYVAALYATPGCTLVNVSEVES